MKRLLLLLLALPLAGCTTGAQTRKVMNKMKEEPRPEAHGCPPSTIGIETRRLTVAMRNERSLPTTLHGPIVTEIIDGSPAIRAGLSTGDIITSIDGDDVASDCDFIGSIQDRDCDEPVKIEFWRQGRIERVSLEVLDAPAFYEKACEAGSATACFRLGIQAKSGYGRTKDEGRAIELSRRACEHGSASGCSALGKLYLDKGAPNGWDEVVTLFKRACEGKNAEACTNLGFMHATGTGVTRDDPASMPWFRRGCELGDPEGCYNVGLMLEQGRGVAQSDEEALRAYDEACTGGSADACTNAGWLIERGRGGPKDEGRALELFRKGCLGSSCAPSNANGCVNWGRAYRDGIGTAADPLKAATIFEDVCDRTSNDAETEATIARACSLLGALVADKDRERAISLYKRGCAHDDTFGCYNLGVLTLGSDPAEAQTYFTKACDHDDFEACFESAQLHRKAESYEAATSLYEKACDAEVARACVNLGILYADGAGVPKDVPRAMALFTSACEHEQGIGCFNAARHYDEADGVPEDKKKAKELFARACELGIEQGCARK